MNAAANFSTDGSADLTQSQTGITYIFTVPPESPLRNCSGTVVSLQYCYQARNGDRENNRTVFNFLSLTQNGMRFTVNRRISTRTIPSNTICTKPSGNIQQICCDNTSLSIYDRFQIPSSSGFAFGVGITNRNVRPLAFTTSQTEYQVEQYRTSLGTTNPFTLASNEQMNNSFLLFRLFLGMIKNFYYVVIVIIDTLQILGILRQPLPHYSNASPLQIKMDWSILPTSLTSTSMM